MTLYIYNEGRPLGPCSEEQVRSLVESGLVLPNDLVRTDETEDWRPLSSLPEFSDSRSPESAPPPPLPNKAEDVEKGPVPPVALTQTQPLAGPAAESSPPEPPESTLHLLREFIGLCWRIKVQPMMPYIAGGLGIIVLMIIAYEISQGYLVRPVPHPDSAPTADNATLPERELSSQATEPPVDATNLVLVPETNPPVAVPPPQLAATNQNQPLRPPDIPPVAKPVPSTNLPLPELAMQLSPQGFPFGAYDAAMVREIQKQWLTLTSQHPLTRHRSGRVIVEFRLHRDGKVSRVQVVRSEVGEVLAYVCVQAIQRVAPFPPWPTEYQKRIREKYRTISFCFTY